MRKLTRMMLMNVGAKTIYEAADGVAALDIIRTANPDVAILDWDLAGAERRRRSIKIVRSPEVFPKPHLPIIMSCYRQPPLPVGKGSCSHQRSAAFLGCPFSSSHGLGARSPCSLVYLQSLLHPIWLTLKRAGRKPPFRLRPVPSSEL